MYCLDKRTTLADNYIFADEAGCFGFHRKPGASKFFMLCTISTDNCDFSSQLLDIKRKLVSGGEEKRNKLHATTDTVQTRYEVYEVLKAAYFRIDCTILEKSKAQMQTRTDDQTFYRYAWYYHFKEVGPKVCRKGEKTLLTAAALGTKKTKAAFAVSLNNAIQQIVPRDRWSLSFIESSMDPGLWAADYAAWAIQRKWERSDDHFYDLISDKIDTEFDLWQRGKIHYY